MACFSRNPGVLPPPAEGHRGVRRAEDGVLPEPEGGGQRPAVLPAERAEPGTDPARIGTPHTWSYCFNLLGVLSRSRRKKFVTCCTLHLSRTSFPESTSKVRRSGDEGNMHCFARQKKESCDSEVAVSKHQQCPWEEKTRLK